MATGQFFKHFLCALSALTLCGAAYFIDTSETHSEITLSSLLLARQITSQVHSLSLFAQEKLEPDPLARAVRLLNIGTDPRILEIALVRGDSVTQDLEKYKLNPQTGVFSYIKIFNPEHSEGIRIHMQTGYVGFLGARSRWSNDILIATLFGLLLSLHLLMIRPLHLEKIPDEAPNDSEKYENSSLPSSRPLDSEQVRNFVLDWVSEARSVLTQLGIHVKGTVQQGQLLASAAAKSRENVRALQNHFNNIKNHILDLENSLVEGEENIPFFKQTLVQLKGLAEKTTETSSSTLQSYDDVFQSTRTMSRAITKAMQSLLEMAKMLQEIKEKSG